MGKRLIIKGANFVINAIDRISPSTTYYSVIYDLSYCIASNSATSIAAGSSYSVTLSPNSGYVISSATVTHNGVEINSTSGYTYNIPSVSGNILVECVAIEEQVTPILPKVITPSDYYYTLADTCYASNTSNSSPYGNFFRTVDAQGADFVIIDVEAYRGCAVKVQNESASLPMRTVMYNSNFVPTNIPSYMGESIAKGATNLDEMLASGWTVRQTVESNNTVTYPIPSDAKWFYWNTKSNGTALSFSVTIVEGLELPKTITQDDWAYTSEDTCYLVYPSSGNLYFRSGSDAVGAGFAIIDVSDYAGCTLTINNTSSLAMRLYMFKSSFDPQDIPDFMGEGNTGTNLYSHRASGWTARQDAVANATKTLTIPSDAKWFYFSTKANNSVITFTITISL